MSTTKKLALNLLGLGLIMAAVLVLLFGLFNVMFGLAWTNGSAQDLFLLFLFVLYAIPAGYGSLRWGIFLLRSTNEETYVPRPVGSQRPLGICLLLPAIAALLLLIVGYPYRFWLADLSVAILLVLLAAALFVRGSYLLKDARARAQT